MKLDNCIRIVNDPHLHARSASCFGWRRLWIGLDYWQSLPQHARRALIAHEMAHLHGHHTEWRVAAMLLMLLNMAALCYIGEPMACLPMTVIAWAAMRELFHWQEYRADAVAAHHGNLHGMLHILQSECPESLTHPKNMDRRRKLMHSPA